jgi:hypothetical protein
MASGDLLPVLVGFSTTNSTPGVGADIVMESMTLIDPNSAFSIAKIGLAMSTT